MTGLFIAVFLAMIIIGIAVGVLTRWSGNAGKLLDGLGDLSQPQPGDDRIITCARCILPPEAAFGKLPCACEHDCGADHCLGFMAMSADELGRP